MLRVAKELEATAIRHTCFLLEVDPAQLLEGEGDALVSLSLHVLIPMFNP
jgi:hypothetical protein